jgi:hypothetical protein
MGAKDGANDRGVAKGRGEEGREREEKHPLLLRRSIGLVR